MTEVVYANGVRTANSYNANRLWLDAIETKNSGNTVLYNVAYSRDLAGRISTQEVTSVGAAFIETWSYTYDRLDQLLSAVNSDDAASSRSFTCACPDPIGISPAP